MSDRDLSPPTAFRDSGIDLLGQLPWGAHVCLFHETDVDLLEIEVPYFAAGLKANEYCLWLASNPIDPRHAEAALRAAVPDFDRRQAAGQIAILSGDEWYFGTGRIIDSEGSLTRLEEIFRGAIAGGYDGLRVAGNLMVTTGERNQVLAYEHMADRALAERQIIALCAYPLSGCRASDVFDTVQAHGISITRRQGSWELLQAREAARANPVDPIDAKIAPAVHPSLTPRERVALEQIVRGHTTKEAARSLGISPRTVEFHRANIMRKLGARNTADLVRRALGEGDTPRADDI